MNKVSTPAKLSANEARKELWFRGNLAWKLKPHQKSLYDLYYNNDHKVMTWLLARRSGKSYCLSVLAVEQCLKEPNSIVKFVSPTKIQMRNNIRPLIKKVLDDCPDELRPAFNTNDNIYYFKNGSEIQLAGSDSGHAEKLRGSDSHVWFVDEAGSCSDLSNIVKNILIPTTLITKGRGILASTPPLEADHDFITFIEEAEVKNALIKKTVYDNTMLTKKDIDDMAIELGGVESDSFKRELLCEIIKDEKISVLPEFNSSLQENIIQPWKLPAHFDTYVAMDLGFTDLTAALFGYYDFRADKIIIQDEIMYDFSKKEQDIEKLTDLIHIKEKELWTNPLTLELRKTYKRVCDINPIVTKQITTFCLKKGIAPVISFQPPDKKDHKGAAVNKLRQLMNSHKVIIDPKCVNLIRHLNNVRWKKGGSEIFARSADDGHYDFVDALIYFVRAVEFSRNPYPRGYDLNLSSDSAFYTKPITQTSNVEVFRTIFNTRRK